ncbi:hypothetical protein EZV62_008503 [Acer yangbiense]|uniref:Cytochrome b5 heme-binding domain-containing protein n=1 Tax=Acer yangbiense TaxID=1000413 RepID=A0A5C7IDV5_9ROSI|nr:hypothetical protein EZV62_008503 [Acer yangbiense]
MKCSGFWLNELGEEEEAPIATHKKEIEGTMEIAGENEKKYITTEELQKHNKHEDLWISIQGKVYNVTDWANEHPGGDIPIMNLAGQDVTVAFLTYHPGTAWRYLDRFFTGYHLEDFHVTEVSRDYRRLANEFAKQGLFEKKQHVTS